MESRYSYHQVQKTRKFIQRQAQSLQNRIKLLQQQDKRTNKKITQTNKRANQVVQAKRNYQKKIHDRIQRGIQKQRTLSQQRQYINSLRYQRNKGQIFIKASLLQSKKQQAATVKAVKNQCNLIVNNINSRIHQQKRENVIKVKQQSLFKSLRKTTSNSPTKIGPSVKRSETVQGHEELKIQKLRLLKQLQNREAELVKKLLNAQVIQKQTYEEYQKTVNNNPVMDYLSRLQRINSNQYNFLRD